MGWAVLSFVGVVSSPESYGSASTGMVSLPQGRSNPSPASAMRTFLLGLSLGSLERRADFTRGVGADRARPLSGVPIRNLGGGRMGSYESVEGGARYDLLSWRRKYICLVLLARVYQDRRSRMVGMFVIQNLSQLEAQCAKLGSRSPLRRLSVDRWCRHARDWREKMDHRHVMGGVLLCWNGGCHCVVEIRVVVTVGYGGHLTPCAPWSV